MSAGGDGAKSQGCTAKAAVLVTAVAAGVVIFQFAFGIQNIPELFHGVPSSIQPSKLDQRSPSTPPTKGFGAKLRPVLTTLKPSGRWLCQTGSLSWAFWFRQDGRAFEHSPASWFDNGDYWKLRGQDILWVSMNGSERVAFSFESSDTIIEQSHDQTGCNMYRRIECPRTDNLSWVCENRTEISRE